MTSCETFDKIVVLSLRDLQLTEVFKYLGRCANLQILFVSGNQIGRDDFTKHLHHVKSVKKLDLSANSLDSLPKEPALFAKMVSLQFLCLDKNNIASVSRIRGLKGAPNLRYLSLQGNPI